MNTFTNQDIERYYDQSEVHYRMLWKLKKSMGLHYGIWDSGTKSLADAVLNTNRRLMELGNIKAADIVLDAGCGIGGSAIYLAKQRGCRVQGITLSRKQADTATALANEHNVAGLLEFTQQDYTCTSFADNTFDVVWAIESMETAADKQLFFKEMGRVLKPGGRLLIGDIFKPEPYDINGEIDMQTVLHGWAMTDILSIPELRSAAAAQQMEVGQLQDVSHGVKRSVHIMYAAGILGMFGTKLYNLFYNASYFSRIHYKTGLAQKRAYDRHKWGYYLVAIINRKN